MTEEELDEIFEDGFQKSYSRGLRNGTSFTVVNNRARIRMKLNLYEYCIADMIYHLANNPNSLVPGWCYASKTGKAVYFGVSERTVMRIQAKLKELVLIEVNELGHVRTTQKWYDNVVLDSGVYYENPIAKNLKCFYCETSILKTPLEVDHFIPRSKGGREVEKNLVLACAGCNRAKKTMTGVEFFEAMKKPVRYPPGFRVGDKMAPMVRSESENNELNEESGANLSSTPGANLSDLPGVKMAHNNNSSTDKDSIKDKKKDKLLEEAEADGWNGYSRDKVEIFEELLKCKKIKNMKFSKAEQIADQLIGLKSWLNPIVEIKKADLYAVTHNRQYSDWGKYFGSWINRALDFNRGRQVQGGHTAQAEKKPYGSDIPPALRVDD